MYTNFQIVYTPIYIQCTWFFQKLDKIWYILRTHFSIKWEKFCIFNVHIFLKENTQTFKICTQTFKKKNFNFSKNAQNSVHSSYATFERMYTIFIKKNAHNFVYLKYTLFQKKCKQFYTFNVHNFSKNVPNFVYSMYTIFQMMYTILYILTYTIFQKMHTIMYIQHTIFQRK